MSDHTLRLRLHVQRSGLPDSRIVFLLEASENTTVTQLLEQVNELLPLESPHWGLEDYVVELPSSSFTKRFECLHYQPVSKLLDKDDEVVVRPLSSEELKKRFLGGRHQISIDGRRLVDGVPFGRPLLKRPRGRPPVDIAPRKCSRPLGNGLQDVEDDDDYGQADDESMQLVPYVDSDADENGEDTSEVEEMEEDELLQLQEEARDALIRRASHGSCKAVRFAAVEDAPAADNHDSGSEDEDFQDRDADSDSDSDSYDSDSDEEDAPPEFSSKKMDNARASTSTVPPHQGKSRTKKRNARRRAKRAMDRARQQEEANNEQAGDAASATEAPKTAEASLEKAEEPGEPAIDAPTNKTPAESPASLSRRLRLDMSAGRRLLVSALGLRSSKTAPVTEPSEQQATKQLQRQLEPEPEQEIQEPKEQQKDPPPGHPDHWASRMDYVAVECCDPNLMVDEPSFPFVQPWHARSNQNRGRIQQKMPAPVKAGAKRKQEHAVGVEEPRPKRRAAPPPSETSSESSSESSSDSSSDSDFHGCDAESDADSDDGDYNEAETEQEHSSDSSSESDEKEDAKGKPRTEEDDLPSLPADVAALPALEPGQAVEGMVVTWKNWILSEQTGWQPQVADATARVVGVDDEGATLQVVLARRDRELTKKQAKQYDDETGERVYGRFEAPDLEEDDTEDVDDSGQRTLVFAELLEPRVLKMPESL